MGSINYNLTWQTYSDHLKQMLQDLVNDEASQDVTLVCDDRVKIKAHKIVLKSCSSFFADIFSDSTSAASYVYLRGINHQEIKPILQFIYLGEATFSEEHTEEFFKVVECLGIKELSKNIQIKEFDKEKEPIENMNEDEIEEETFKQEESFGNSEENEVNESFGDIEENEDENEEETSNQNDLYDEESEDNEEETFIQDELFGDIEENEYENKDESVPLEDKCEEQTFNQKNQKLKDKPNLKSQVISPTQCPVCAKQFSTKENMKTHHDSKHKGVKYSCDKCEYEVSDRANLARHIRSKHNGVRFPCYQCGLQLSSKAALQKHGLKIHSLNIC